ncbi:MAG: peroxiredoxin family protein [Bacteroidota bacterium]
MKAKKNIATVILFLLFLNIISAQKALKKGVWGGSLQLNDTTQLPFNFEIKNTNKKLSFEIINAEERIIVDEIFLNGDSVIIKMPVFDSEFRCKNLGDSLKGYWINHSRKDKNRIPFIAFVAREKQIFATKYLPKIEGRWEVDFSPNSKEKTKAMGLFKDGSSHDVKGTFITETGDYRYLSGERGQRNFYLSCFDGAHAFLFTGNFVGADSVVGHFYSGAHWHESWAAQRNEKFELRDPDSLTHLKPGFTKVDFSFKNLEGKKVSLSDEKFRNKVVIIQLMGSWCPNCMDETKFLAPLYDKYRSKGLEVLGLAFERTDDFNKAVSNVSRTKKRFNVNYELLITEKTGKDQASKALPMLNKVMAFPTTIYIDKKGLVRKIYTGFYGPATGDNYTRFIEQTTLFVEKMLEE